MITRLATGSRLAMVTVAAVVTLQAQGGGRTQDRIHVKVTDRPRPISEAVMQIERYFGHVITYEDASYVHPSDIVDITEEVSRERSQPQRVLGIRKGSIDVEYQRTEKSATESVRQLLQLVLRDSERARNAGEFRADWIGGAFHVIPVAITGRDGRRQQYRPILDTLITLPPIESNGREFVERIAEALTNASGRSIRAGRMPSGLLRKRLYLPANREPARLVLWRGLQALAPQLSWQFLCSVGETGICALNVHSVPTRSQE